MQSQAFSMTTADTLPAKIKPKVLQKQTEAMMPSELTSANLKKLDDQQN
jgi:hypothetical protein